MTRTTTSNTVSAIGIGAIATIPYTFPITADTDLVGVQRDLDGAETPLTLATDYTVTGAGTLAGGNIVSVAAIPLGYTWVFRRVRDITQMTDLRNQGAYYPEVIEDALDKLTDIAQQHEEEIGRCLIAATTDTLSSYELPSLTGKEGYALGVISGPALGLVANDAVSLAADLAKDLANTTEATRGSGMMGHNDTLAYPDGSTGAFLNKLKSYASALAGAGMSGFSYALAYAANTVGAAIKAVMDRCTVLEGVAVGQCRLVYVDAATIKLQRFNGKYLMINGAWQVIPAAGVTLASTGLAATTLYYIYAYMAGTTLTLEASTTGHSTDATTGVEIKTGDASRTFVGMVYCPSAATFADSLTQRLVKSYFNRQDVGAKNLFTAQRSSTSTAWVELNSEIRIQFLAWANEVVNCSLGSIVLNSSTNNTYVGIGVDSVAIHNDLVSGMYNNNAVPAAVSGQSSPLSEGLHYATYLGRVTGGTGYFGNTTAGLFGSIFLGLSD